MDHHHTFKIVAINHIWTGDVEIVTYWPRILLSSKYPQPPRTSHPAAILSSTEVEMVKMEVKSGWWQTTAHTRKKDRRSWRQDMVKRCCGQIKGDRLLRSRVSCACRPSDHHWDHYPYALFSRHVSATQLELRCREISITRLTWYCLFAHIFISCFMSWTELKK